MRDKVEDHLEMDLVLARQGDYPGASGVKRMAAEIASLREERDALREALRPFAELANVILAEAPHDVLGWPAFDDCEGKEHVISMDQLRALSPAMGEE